MIIDIHNHILPGLDDGALSMEDAVEMAAQAAHCGIRKIVATPHFQYKNSISLSEIEDVFESLSDILKRERINVKLEKCMEIMATDDLPQLLLQNEVWTYPDSPYFLVEFSPDEDGGYFDWLLDRCAASGFIPIIAHPERYRAVRHCPELAEGWCKKGYGIQINRDSLLGYFGEHANSCAHQLLKRGWANCIASDAHTPQQRNSLWGEAFKTLPSVYGFHTLAHCLETIPEKILSGKPLL